MSINIRLTSDCTVGVITISIVISIIAITVIVVLVCYTRKKRIKRQMENGDSSIRMTNITGESIAYLALERIFAGVLLFVT
jgi:uncharacterized membrane protein YidH (DUF202 family)